MALYASLQYNEKAKVPLIFLGNVNIKEKSLSFFLLYPQPNWKLFIEFQHDRNVFLSLNLSISDYNWSICYAAELILSCLNSEFLQIFQKTSKKYVCIYMYARTHTHTRMLLRRSQLTTLLKWSIRLILHVDKATQKKEVI